MLLHNTSQYFLLCTPDKKSLAMHDGIYYPTNSKVDVCPVFLSVSHLPRSPGMQIRVGTSSTFTVAVHLLPSPLHRAFDLRPMPTQPMGVNCTQTFRRLARSSLLALPIPWLPEYLVSSHCGETAG